MKNKTVGIIISLMLTLVLGSTAAMANTKNEALPDSSLYYGQVTEINQHNNEIQSINLSSEKYGEFTMSISNETYWIDDTEKKPSLPSTLKEGESVYIFHSPYILETYPPKSEAFAIVRNVPLDTGCGKYMEIDKIVNENGKIKIIANNGMSEFYVDKSTNYTSYLTKNKIDYNYLYENANIMVWYTYSSDLKTNVASDIMLLSAVSQPLTRGQFVQMLYEKAGKPQITTSVNFKDVPKDNELYAAVVWAKEKNIAVGYDNLTFGVNDTLNREQMIVMLWRYAGSPILMDYPGLNAYSDLSKISSFANQAMLWAHQKGLIITPSNKPLEPQGNVNTSEAERMIKTLA